MGMVQVESALELILMYGSKDIINVGILTNHKYMRQTKIVIFAIHVVDIVYNFLTQHEINETDKTVFLVDSIKFYISKYFWLDLFSLLNFVILIFYTNKDYLLSEIIYRAMTKAHEMDALEEKFISENFPSR